MWIRAKGKEAISGLLIKDLPAFDLLESSPTFIYFPYSILLTQACDIDEFCKCMEKKENDGNCVSRQIITQMIFCPAFDEDSFKAGTHLKEQYEYQMPLIPSKELDKYKSQQNMRYHYLKSNIAEIPGFFIDFKQYFTLPALFVMKYLKRDGSEYYRLNHLAYTSLADRFAYYLQRVVLPRPLQVPG